MAGTILHYNELALNFPPLGRAQAHSHDSDQPRRLISMSTDAAQVGPFKIKLRPPVGCARPWDPGPASLAAYRHVLCQCQ